MTEIKQFDALVAQVTEFVSPARGLKVIDASSASDAVETGKKVKEYQKKIEGLRKELVGPLNDQVKTINDYAKTIVAPLEAAERHLKSEIGRYEDEQDKIRQEQLRKLELEREAERKRLEAEAAAAVKEAEPEQAAGITAVKTIEFQAKSREISREARIVSSKATTGVSRPWKAEVVDEQLVPREFLSIDMTKINAAMRAGAREIPGVKIFQETRVAFGKNTAVSEAAIADDYFGGKQ